MRGKIVRLLAATAIAASIVVAPSTQSAFAHGTCSIGGRLVEVGPHIAAFGSRSCTEGHARLRMTFWLLHYENGRWRQDGPATVAECHQCRSQAQQGEMGLTFCAPDSRYKIHFESALIFNSAGLDVTDSHPQSPSPPFNTGPERPCA